MTAMLSPRLGFFFLDCFMHSDGLGQKCFGERFFVCSVAYLGTAIAQFPFTFPYGTGFVSMALAFEGVASYSEH